MEEIVCFEERIVILDSSLPQHEVRMQDWLVDLGHQKVDATKRQLRLRLRFLGMDNALERAVERCLACQASVEEYQSPITANKDTGQAMELPVCRTLGAHTGRMPYTGCDRWSDTLPRGYSGQGHVPLSLAWSGCLLPWGAMRNSRSCSCFLQGICL